MTAAPQGTGLGRRLASNAIASAAGRIVVLLMWLLLTPPLVRALGAEAFAVWSIFYAISFWLLALDLGLSQIALRYVAAARATTNPEQGGEYATLSVMGYIVIGVFWGIISPLVTDAAIAWLRVPAAVAPDARWAIAAAAAVFMLAGIVQTCLGVLQAYERFDLAAWGLSATALFQGSGVAVGLLRGEGLAFMVTAVVAGWAVGALVCGAMVRVAAHGFRWASPARAARHWREALAFGGPVQGANVLAVTHQQLDKFLLARMVALAAVTPYELGMRIASATASFPQFLMTAIHPTATTMHTRGDHAGLAALYRRTTRWVLVVSALLAAALIGGAHPLLAAWLGAPAPDAALALQGLAMAGYLASPAGTTSVMARAAGRTPIELEWSASALLVHLAIALLAIPAFGLRGALVATVVANAVSSVWFVSRLGRALALPSRAVLVDAFGLGLLALLGGIGGALLLDRAMPPAMLASTWSRAALVSGAALLLCGGLLAVFRFVDHREAWTLLRRGSAA